MENKTSGSLIKFEKIIKMLFLMLDIWTRIREDISDFLEANIDVLPDNIFIALCKFAEIFDNIENKIYEIGDTLMLTSLTNE